MGKDHGVLLYLNGKLQSSFNKVMSDLDLSKSPAGLYVFVCGLYQMGKLTKPDFERWTQFYAAKKLTETEETKPLTPNELAIKQKLDEKARLFKQILSQWTLDHKMGWRETWVQEAEKYPDMPEAKAIIERYFEKIVKVGVN